MQFNAITAAAVLAFTSAAMATGAEPASTAVAQFVPQPTSAVTVVLASEDEDIVVGEDGEGFDKRWTRGGHGLYGNWQKGLTRGAKRDVNMEDGPEDGDGDNDDDVDEEGLDKRWTRGGHGLYGNWQKGLTRGAKRDVHPGDHRRPGSDDGHGHRGIKSGAEGNAMGPGGRHGGVKRAEGDEHRHGEHGWHGRPENTVWKGKGADFGEHGKLKRDADRPEHGGKDGHHGKPKKLNHMFKNGTYTGTHTTYSHHSKSAHSTSSITST